MINFISRRPNTGVTVGATLSLFRSLFGSRRDVDFKSNSLRKAMHCFKFMAFSMAVSRVDFIMEKKAIVWTVLKSFCLAKLLICFSIELE